MNFLLKSLSGLLLFIAATPYSGAYVTLGGRKLVSPNRSVWRHQQPRQQLYAPPKPTTLVNRKNDNPAQKALDFYCKMVWIARPDLFLYDRLARAAWDGLTKTIDKLEQENLPENALNKALLNTEKYLSEIQSSYNELTDTQRRMLVQKSQAQAAADDLYRKARGALSEGYELVCRDYLTQRQELLEGVKRLDADFDAQDAMREKLYEAFHAVKKQFYENVAKRDDLLKRAKTAQSVTKINEMLTGFFNNKSLSNNAFDVLERNVESMEAAAGFSSHLSKESLTEDERLEMEFAKLEAGSEAVDYTDSTRGKGVEEVVAMEMEMMKNADMGFDAGRSSSFELRNGRGLTNMFRTY